jgi:tripeptide aminopeptidase
MPIRSDALPQAARPLTSSSLAAQPQVRVALDWFAKNLKWINDQQAALTEIPAPSFQEEKRSAAVKALFAAEGLPVQTDKLGNVIAELRGANDKECILIAAHLDTVFPGDTDVKVRRRAAAGSGNLR